MADALEELLTTASGRKPASSSSAAPSADFPKAKIDDTGRLQILMNERSGLVSRVNGKDPEDRIRASKDLESLDREIKAMGGTIPTAAPVPQPAASIEDVLKTQAAKPQVQPTPTAEQRSSNPFISYARQQAGTADTALGSLLSFPSMAVAETGYPLVRLGERLGLVEPGRAERGRENIYKKFVEPVAQPIGTVTGVSETPEYRGEATQRIMKFVAENMDKGADWISKNANIPKADVENAMNWLAFATGSKLSPTVSKGFNKAVGGVGGAVEAGIEKGVSAAKGAKEKISPTPEKVYQPLPESSIAGVGAARSEFNPFSGKITGEETARGAYPTVKTSKIAQDVHPGEQRTRASILSEVLGEDATGIRQGVLTGNEDILRNEHALAKRGDTAAAKLMQEQLAKEQNALSNYAAERVNRTGANQNFVNDYERGQLINDAFAGDEGLTGWFKSQKSQLYDAAKATVGDNPISTSHVDNLLQNKQFRAGLGLKGNEGVAKSAENLINLAKNTGFEDEFGNFHPANSISAWDAVRKSLNQNWTKDNASVIRQINQAIDKDVAAAGGGDLYKAADRMHQAEKTLFGSKGIKTLFGDIDPNGVQTGAAFEVIPKKLNSMPFDQWRHIYDAADQLSRGSMKVNGEMVAVPDEIRMAAQAAKNEMAGALARDVQEAGAGKQGEWSAHAANKRMNALDQKIRHALPPEEVQAMHKLNYAGQLMPTHGYEGAALQASRLERLSEKFPSFGATIGAKAGPAGIAAGKYLGEKTSGILKKRSQRKAAEELQRQFQENLRKGREQ